MTGFVLGRREDTREPQSLAIPTRIRNPQMDSIRFVHAARREVPVPNFYHVHNCGRMKSVLYLNSCPNKGVVRIWLDAIHGRSLCRLFDVPNEHISASSGGQVYRCPKLIPFGCAAEELLDA